MDFLKKHASFVFVERRWLFLLSALMWGGVGVMLCRLAYLWLEPEEAARAIPLGLAGIAFALVIFRFGFSKVADKNIKRISHLGDKETIFAFQSVKSYLIIVFMMGLGITLRHSPFPKPYLAVMYTGIGGGLFLSSMRYYKHVS